MMLPSFRERNQNLNAENEFSNVLTHIALCDEIISVTISLYFSTFSFPRNFLEARSKFFHAPLCVQFNSVFNPWSSNSCVIGGPT
jgi:hypothetical protein